MCRRDRREGWRERGERGEGGREGDCERERERERKVRKRDI